MSANRISTLVFSSLLLCAGIIAGQWTALGSTPSSGAHSNSDAIERSCIGLALELPANLLSVRWIDSNVCRPHPTTPLAGPLKQYGGNCGRYGAQLIMADYRSTARAPGCRNERGLRI
jgi:hypothetical protein